MKIKFSKPFRNKALPFPYLVQERAPNRLKVLEQIPFGCHAWVAKTSCNPLCNTIPCCGWFIRFEREKRNTSPV